MQLPTSSEINSAGGDEICNLPYYFSNACSFQFYGRQWTSIITSTSVCWPFRTAG
jgi:hypothetical protein